VKRLLIYEPAYRRLAAEIDAVEGIAPVLMTEDGGLSLGGVELSAEAAAVDASWFNGDVFGAPCVRDFARATLKSPNLAWVQSGAAGTELPVFGAIVSKGAILTTQHVQAVGIAEYVLWGVLDHLQRGPERRAAQSERRWEKLPFREIAGSTWLVVGFGAIGQAVAERARAFGAQVIGVRRRAGDHPMADRMTTDWREALPEADVVVLSLPLTPESAGMADGSAFAAMKPGSVFVNVGRGGLVDEAALLAALDRGTPEHALLDVFGTEPLPAESPFWAHPRVTLTAHASPLGSGLQARSDRVFLDNLRRWAAGEPLHDAVDPEAVRASVAPA
jgi:phosphoglycerate dehydrogenase-like enzyme